MDYDDRIDETGTQRSSPETPTASSTHFIRIWAWESFALLGGAMSFGGMVALLARFDGVSPFEWYGVTLNTIVSILSATLKVFVLFTIAECVGQWKWILGSLGERSLMEFEQIDLASRGPLGCLFLLYRTETPWILRLGLLLTIFSIAMDPFAQQLIRIKQEERYLPSPPSSGPDSLNVSTHAIAARSEICDNGRYGVLGNKTNVSWESIPESGIVYTATPETSLAMELAISSALSGVGDNRRPASCPSTNCTWPPFDTIGVCSRCNDVKPKLKKVEDFVEVLEAMAEHPRMLRTKYGASAWALPNGHFLANMNNGTLWTADQTYWMTAFGTADPNKTNTMQDLDTLIWSTSVIQIEPDAKSTRFEEVHWEDKPIVATECAIYYCVRRVETSFQNNVLNETSFERTDAALTPDSFQPKPNFTWPMKDPGIKVTPNGRPSMEWNEALAARWRDNAKFHFPGNHSQPIYSITKATVATIGALIRSKLHLDLPQVEAARPVFTKLLGEDAVGFNGFEGDMMVPGSLPSSVNPKWMQNFVPDGRDGLPESFKSLADSITNEMRQSWTSGPARFGDAPVVGLIGSTYIFYKVTWPWVALHAIVLLGGLVFCFLTMRSSHLDKGLHQRAPVWKSNSLAVLKQGATTGQIFKDVWGLNQMEKIARAGHRMAVPSEEEKILLRNRD
ncbi:unnamed protein product [Clonostachys rosea]|uniref:Beta-lactamase-related domain-containing protein n=1 Tax=Bionectria ochroleuca TaxID=29856 RepID=A0ABY6U1N7_BIOOC|nr:unnamed protein product [Clonostachys rosea]